MRPLNGHRNLWVVTHLLAMISAYLSNGNKTYLRCHVTSQGHVIEDHMALWLDGPHCMSPAYEFYWP